MAMDLEAISAATRVACREALVTNCLSKIRDLQLGTTVAGFATVCVQVIAVPY